MLRTIPVNRRIHVRKYSGFLSASYVQSLNLGCNFWYDRVLLAEPRVPTMLEEPRACDEASMVGYDGKRVPNEGMRGVRAQKWVPRSIDSERASNDNARERPCYASLGADND